MILLAIDSGIEKTGFAVFNKNKSFEQGYSYIKSGLISTLKTEKIENRLMNIYASLDKIIDEFHPNLIVIEQLFFFKNQKTIVKVSQSQGVIILLAALKKIKIEFLTPLQIKQTITGYGQADKKSVQKMLKILLKTNNQFKQDDEADAVACGLAYCYRSDINVK